MIYYLPYTPDKTNYNVKKYATHLWCGVWCGVVWCVADLVWWAALCQKVQGHFLAPVRPCIYIYTVYIHCPPKVWKRGFGQYWHESFLICNNFALIRDNTNYENIFYYINSLYIEKTYIFDSSKYPPLAAITAQHNLGIRAVSLFKH